MAPSLLGFLVMVLVGIVGIEALMGVSAFMHGENLWAKSQKTMAYQLQRYIQTDSEEALARFNEAKNIQRTFRDAQALMKADPRISEQKMQMAHQVGLSEADGAKIFRLHQYFHWMPFFDEPFRIWHLADQSVIRLEAIQERVAHLDAAAKATTPELTALSREVDGLDMHLAQMEREFSGSVNQVRYQIYYLLLGSELSLITLMMGLTLWRTWSYKRSRHRMEAVIQSERQRAEVTLAALAEAVITLDTEGRVNYMNPAAQTLCQFIQNPVDPPANLIQSLRLMDPASQQPVLAKVLGELQSGQTEHVRSEHSHHLHRRDGSHVLVTWVATALRDAKGDMSGMVLVLHDNTREHDLVQRLSWLARHDPLTQLANRREFEDRLMQALGMKVADDGVSSHPALSRHDRQSGESIPPNPRRQHVLMMIDLDQFKVINDTCGHAAGDELLRLLSRRMGEHVAPGALLARLGGDEFGLLLPDCAPDVGEASAEKLRSVIEETEFRWGLRRLRTTASIGLVHINDDMTRIGEALSAVDLACYKAKDKGRNQVAVYSAQDAELTLRYGEMKWVQRLQAAMQEGHFFLQAQPIEALQDSANDHSHCELLLRLRDENGQVVPPGDFLPAAERYGLMPLIDRWVVSHALEHIAAINARELAEQGAVQPHVYAINLSGPTFSDKGFAQEVRDWFVQHGVPHHQVCFELTETAAVSNLSDALSFIQEMRGLGCSFALDDFGAGMSSLNYLKHIPVDYLKIDGSLVKNMSDSAVDQAMVEMIHHLARTMGMRTVGEFAENEQIIQLLRQVGVHYAQGYGVARPQDWLV